jgi:hemoglobin/transferrin/lactoferrin receptor protein
LQCTTSVALTWLAIGALSPCVGQSQTASPPGFTASAPTGAVPTGAVPTTAAVPIGAITNTSTRSDRRVDEVPASVSVVSSGDIESRGACDIKDLFRNEVDVTVRAAPGRFGAAGAATGRAGNEGLNIRGLEGNQVLMLVDGVRLPGSFSFGAFSTGRADYIALEATQAAEVLRGPASTSFGSDGLAGVISLRTLDPADVLKTGKNGGGFVRVGATQIDNSAALTAASAWRQNTWQALLLASVRSGHETQNQGTSEAPDNTRTAPNPLDYQQQVVLAKFFIDTTTTHRLGLTFETITRQARTEVISGRAVLPSTSATAVLALQANDRVQRQRVAFEHRYDDLNATPIQQITTRVFVQDASTQQRSAEDRNTAADRTRDNRYREQQAGLTTQAQSSFSSTFLLPMSQRLSYGMDINRSKITAQRDGTPTPSAPAPFGETFPVKPFPDTRFLLAGAFVQSETDFGSGRPVLMPGLRLDHYRLDPAAKGYTGGAVVALRGSAVTPRLGAVWPLHTSFAPYAQWAKGFRAPTPGQVNNGFTNVAAGYQSLGNANLKAETAQSLEVGLRGSTSNSNSSDNSPFGTLTWQLAGYDNRYRDFISQETTGGAGTAADPTIFRYINLAQARIRGVELRAQWRVHSRWQITLATALTRGASTRAGVQEALDSVEPARTAWGLRFNGGAWELQADLLHAQSKSSSRIRSTSPMQFAPAGYTVLDLSARWQPAAQWQVTAQLNNAGNANYWRWSDVRGLADNSAVKDAYTAPGRHLQVAFRHDF